MIPSTAHFIWYGRTLPWLHEMALVSAAKHGGFSRLILHHDAQLDGARRAHLERIPRLELRVIEPERVFDVLDRRSQLLELYTRLSQPAARANVLRAALLYREGGVYLDMDTLTLASLQPLCVADAFCGRERVALPSGVRERGGASLARAYALMALRDVLRRAPDGPRWFRRLEGLYTLAANNAVLGARAGHPLVGALLDGMLHMPEAKQMRRYALGTHLLQDVLATLPPASVTVHAPEVFYPLAPEISEHWFRMREHVDLGVALPAVCRVVHWYASVRTRPWVARIDAGFVRAEKQRQLLSALIARVLDA